MGNRTALRWSPLSYVLDESVLTEASLKATNGEGRRGVRMDEPGFIRVPPCVWGEPADGFEPPPDLTGVTLLVVKRANATYGHHGEMAHGEIYYVDKPRTHSLRVQPQ